METHSSVLAWRIPRTVESDRLQSMQLQRVRHDGMTNIHKYTHTESDTGPAVTSAVGAKRQAF